MALEDIIKTILNDAQKKADKIILEAQKKVNKIKEEYRHQAKDIKKRLSVETKAEEEQILDEARTNTRLFHKNTLLAKKQELIGQVFEKALDKLARLPKDKYLKLLVSLLKQAPKLEGRVEVVPIKGKEKITEEAIKKAKKDFILSKDSVQSKGGFVLKSKDIEIDNTYETLISEKREVLETKIAQILFK